MGLDRRVRDWLESGVVALSGFVPPGSAATAAWRWAREVQQWSAARGHPFRVDGAGLLAERAALTGLRAGGRTHESLGGSGRLLPCADGWLAVSLPRPSDVDLVAPLIEQESVTAPWDALTDWVRDRAAADVVARGRLLGIALSRVGEAAAPLTLPPGEPGGAPSRQPLVVDFSALWAGPLGANLLGLGGARVIKVESAGRLDGARLGNQRFYDLLHAGHESLCVDPDAPADRTLLRTLVDAADVVIESSRPRALAGWGLSAAAAVAGGTVWVSITAYGRGAPDRVGFGDDVAAGAGLVGWVDGEPRFVGDAIADPLTGLAAATAALRALDAGRGELLDIAMASVVASTLDGTGAIPAGALTPAVPRARSVSGRARAPGADNAAIMAEFR